MVILFIVNTLIKLLIVLLGVSAGNPLLSMNNNPETTTTVASTATTAETSTQESESDNPSREQQLIDDILMGANITPNDQLVQAIKFGLVNQLAELWEQSSKDTAGIRVSINDDNARGIISPLLYAMTLGDLAIIKALRELGATITEGDKTIDSNLVCFVASQGHTHLLDYMVSEFPESLNKANTNSMTPLMGASMFGHSSTVDKLLELGATTAAIPGNPYSPLSCAAAEGHINIVKRLLAYDRNLLHQGYGTSWKNPLLVAANNEQNECVSELLKAAHHPNASKLSLNIMFDKAPSALIVLIQNNDTANAILLIELIKKNQDTTINDKEKSHGYTALTIAVGNNNRHDIVNALLTVPFINPNCVDNDKFSVLEVALLNNNMEDFNALINHNDTEITCLTYDQKQTILEHALKERNIPAAHSLVEKQKSITAQFLNNPNKLAEAVTKNRLYSHTVLANCIAQAGGLYKKLSDQDHNKILLQSIIGTLLSLTNKNSQKVIERLRKLIPSLPTKREKQNMLDNVAGLQAYSKEIEDAQRREQEKALSDKVAQELLQEEDRKKALKKKKTQKSSGPQTTERLESKPQQRGTASEPIKLPTSLTQLDETPDREFTPAKKTSKNKLKKLSTKNKTFPILTQIEDFTIFADRSATLRVVVPENLLDSSYQRYLKNYEPHERIVDQQDTLQDYHTFSQQVEHLWAAYAHCSEEDLTTAQTNAFIASRNIAYTRKLTFTIDGFINSTRGKFEIVLLIPNEHEINQKPLCIHRFFRPAFTS